MVMTKATKKILSRLIYAVAHHDKNLWWELKRQIFDTGYQAYYPWEGEFESAAKRALANLPKSDQSVLIDEWRRNRPNDENVPNTKILLSYVPVIVEQVVERARSAAYRTKDW